MFELFKTRKAGKNGDRAATEATLEKSRDQVFRALIENASDVITILSATGIIEYESPSVKPSTRFTEGLSYSMMPVAERIVMTSEAFSISARKTWSRLFSRVASVAARSPFFPAFRVLNSSNIWGGLAFTVCRTGP